MAKWKCSCTWEECSKWAQSNGRRLCARHFTFYDSLARRRINVDAEILVSIRNNVDAAPAENVHNQINNNDNHHVADDPQPVGVPPNIPGDGREEAPGGEQELESEQRAHDPVGNVVAENADNNAQLLDMAVDENIGNQANNNDHGDVMERLLDTAAVENIVGNQNNDHSDVTIGLLDAAPVEYMDCQANNNDSHEMVDAPVGHVPDDIAAVENIENQEDTNNDDNQQVVVDAPVGNVATANDNENIGIVANNEENHDVVGAPVDNVAAIAEVAAVEIIAAAVETITDVQEHEYERSSHMTQFNHQLQSIIQQLRLKDDKINELERRIKELEDWKTTVVSSSWPCTSEIGGTNFSGIDSMSQVQLGGNEDNQGFNGGDDEGKKPHKRRRGPNPFHDEFTAQPPTKRNRALAPNIDQGGSPYYRDFQARRTNAPDPVIADAHAGLINCDVVCYSNAIFQCIASCIHVSDFLQTPPNEEHQRFPLYYEFASVMSSMVSGQESVVDPTSFVDLFRPENSSNNYEEGMYFDSSQWMNQLTMYVPLTDYSFR